MMFAATVTGKGDLSDVLFLIAAIVFLVATLATYLRQAVPRDWVPALIPAGLCLTAAGWWVL